MEFKVVIVVSLSIAIGVIGYYTVAPYIAPFIEEGYKVTLKTLGKCPDVKVKILASIPNNRPNNLLEQLISSLTGKQYCRVYIPA